MTTRPRKKITRSVRTAIIARDGGKCVYCGAKGTKRKPLTLDHVIPHSQGGADNATNLVTACGDCNNERGVMPIDVFAIYLNRYKAQKGVAARVLRALARPI
jgi:5-methylcytosine-specific restriction endonuclease McrA